MPTSPATRRLRRPWHAIAIVAVILGVLAVGVEPSPSTLPAALPVALIAATAAGAIAAMRAIAAGLARTSPDDDRAALAELRSRQAMQLAIGLAPVLLGVALAAVFGHRSSLATAALAAAGVAAVGMPRTRALQAADEAWHERGVPVSIVRALDDATPG